MVRITGNGIYPISNRSFPDSSSIVGNPIGPIGSRGSRSGNWLELQDTRTTQNQPFTKAITTNGSVNRGNQAGKVTKNETRDTEEDGLRGLREQGSR
jgi:hypothetical protein